MAPGSDQISPRHEVAQLMNVVQDGSTTTIVVDRVTWVWCNTGNESRTFDCPSDHEVENNNPKLRSYRLAPNATVIVGDGSGLPATHTDAAGLRSHVADTQSSFLYVLRHAGNGDVTGISQVFAP